MELRNWSLWRRTAQRERWGRWSISLVNMALQESKFNCHKSGTRPVGVGMAIGRREIRGDWGMVGNGGHDLASKGA